jgi:hypothetical protein
MADQAAGGVPARGPGNHVAGSAQPLRRGLVALPWLVLGGFATALAGLPGHDVPWFSGDLGYHLAVSRTVSWTDLSGDGPYAGLPSYYGGLLPVGLQLGHGLLGADHGDLLAVLSWFEPAAWVAAVAVFARALWPARPLPQLAFAVLLLLGVGSGSGALAVGVNAPNVASQVLWPLYPRDLALLLTLVAVGLALRGRWVWASVVTAVVVATEVQVAVLTYLLLTATLLLDDRPRRARTWLLGSALVGLLSSWWWAPRVGWTLAWGTRTDARSFTGDLPHDVGAVVAGVGVLVLAAAVAGLVVLVRSSEGRGVRVLLSWSVLGCLLVAVSLAVPSELLTLRRALLLGSVPLAALAATAVEALAQAVSRALAGRHRATSAVPWAVAVVVVGAIVAPTLPTYADARESVLGAFEGETVAQFGYPDSEWSPVWAELGDGAEVLAPSRDAAALWIRTSRPVTGALLPGYVKTWFDLTEATGRSQESRLAAARAAFANDRGALCAVMAERDLDQVVLRSEPGLLGTLDVAGAQELSGYAVGADGGDLPDPTDPDAPLVLAPGDRLVLEPSLLRGIRVVRVWRSAPGQALGLSARTGGRDLVVVPGAGDGALATFEVELPARGDGPRRPLELRATRSVPVLRVLGLRPDPSVVSGPATVLTRGATCGT